MDADYGDLPKLASSPHSLGTGLSSRCVQMGGPPRSTFKKSDIESESQQNMIKYEQTKQIQGHNQFAVFFEKVGSY